MTIRDLIEMFIDDRFQKFSIYDVKKEDVVFTGYLDDMPDKYEYAEICTIDNLSKGTNILTINVDM